MSVHRAFNERVWELVGPALEVHGFALGGGYAMHAHEISNRPTNDVDSFRRDPLLSEPGVFDHAVEAVSSVLRDAGMKIEEFNRRDFERKLAVTDPRTGEQCVVDLGRDRLPRDFERKSGFGVVVSADDMASMKMRALWERHAERDYVDLVQLLDSERWSMDQLLDLLNELGSISPPHEGRLTPDDWKPGLAEILRDARMNASARVLTRLGVEDPESLYRRLEQIAASMMGPLGRTPARQPSGHVEPIMPLPGAEPGAGPRL